VSIFRAGLRWVDSEAWGGLIVLVPASRLTNVGLAVRLVAQAASTGLDAIFDN
jgi:hypothetical protein